MYDVRRACQTFYGQALYEERDVVRDAFTWLLDALPKPVSPQETQAMEDLVLTCFARVGTACHRDYHDEGTRECAGSPLETAVAALSSTTESCQRLHVWRTAFWRFLDATHPASAAERAAAILRRTFRQPPSLDELAHMVACSRRGLTRDFLTRYDMSCGEFTIRLRLRAFIDLIRNGTTADAAAFDVGYGTYQGLSAALEARTGFTATALQCLSPDAVGALLEGPLGIRPRRWRRADDRPAEGGVARREALPVRRIAVGQDAGAVLFCLAQVTAWL
jgi:AraC-like DNA-binding protein